MDSGAHNIICAGRGIKIDNRLDLSMGRVELKIYAGGRVWMNHYTSNLILIRDLPTAVNQLQRNIPLSDWYCKFCSKNGTSYYYFLGDFMFAAGANNLCSSAFVGRYR